MHRRFLLSASALTLSLSLVALAHPSLVTAHKKFQVTGGSVDLVTIKTQPPTPVLEAAVEKMENDEVALFKKNLADMSKDAEVKDCTLEVSLSKQSSTPRYRSLVLISSQDLHGAHPGYITDIVNYDSKSDKIVKLSDLFLPGTPYLKKLSAYCSRQLKARGLTQDAMFSPGVAPKPDNYKLFYLKPGKLVIYFDVYQVASYADGPQEVAVPLSELAGMLRPEVR